jgi:hypothetical protein
MNPDNYADLYIKGAITALEKSHAALKKAIQCGIDDPQYGAAHLALTSIDDNRLVLENILVEAF